MSGVILLVEDNPDDRDLTLRVLTRYNVANQVDTVGDGAEAIEYLYATGKYAGRDISVPPRLILLDLKLPRFSGLEVLEKVRSNEATKRIPVVILTSSREERDVAASYDRGANSYVAKPVEFSEFTEAVRQLGLYWLLLNEPPPEGTS